MHRRYTLYNITNPDEVRAGFKAVVEPVGPLEYLQRIRKLDVIFSDDQVSAMVSNPMQQFRRSRNPAFSSSDSFDRKRVHAIRSCASLCTY